MTRLAELQPQLARVVNCRFFGGLTEDEIAVALGVTVRTVQRDWAKARMLLQRELEACRPAHRRTQPDHEALDGLAPGSVGYGHLPIGNQCMPALPSRAELLPGTLAMLVLKTLTVDAMHGYAIAQHIERLSDDVLRVQEGTLYPALQMMEVKGWVRSEWKLTPTKRRARYYSITAAGRKQLAQEAREFERVIAAVGRVMQPA